jgi:hypothetical protein
MNNYGGLLPPVCRNCHSLATSTAFYIPLGRHVWWWLNIRPASRESFEDLLIKGKTVCVTPGGIQECLYMEPGHEVAFLKKRLGFIRIAIKQGYASVPPSLFIRITIKQGYAPVPPSLLNFLCSELCSQVTMCTYIIAYTDAALHACASSERAFGRLLSSIWRKKKSGKQSKIDSFYGYPFWSGMKSKTDACNSYPFWSVIKSKIDDFNKRPICCVVK